MIRGSAWRRAAVPAGVIAVLLVIYACTLARDVTFWDAGEFTAAASTFGIPHPPGTPLYVLLLRTAVVLLGGIGVPAAVATSLLSAVCTAAACGAGAALLHRASGDAVAAAAGGITAGTMASVWLNATETEVYAASLALSLALVWSGERAGRRQSLRWTMATAYLLVLSVPLHLSALLAAPAAIFLASGRVSRPFDQTAATRALIMVAACAAAYAMGQMSTVPAAMAAVALAAATFAAIRYPAPQGGILLHAHRRVPSAIARGVLPVAAVLLAGSALLVLILRAQHDPPVNQGNPATVPALLDLVARRQYDVAGLWPRQAPLWLQLGNLGLYADWQVALSLGPTIFPTPLRTGATLLFAALGVYGAVVHRRCNVRSWTGWLLLLVAGSLGAALYLNLKAGPSFGHGVLPPGALREARERDYFFVLAWWTWGAWSGFGAVALARRIGAPAVAGVALALLPAMLNWRSVDRTRLPESVLPRAIAEGLLLPLPPRAVLFVAGDNDTYPLWYAQHTLGMRRDVTVITTPLLPADWYRAELARRDRLLPAAGDSRIWRGRRVVMRQIADHAQRLRRPLAMAVAMPAAERTHLRDTWVLRGPVYVELDTSAGSTPRSGISAPRVDTSAARAWNARLATLTRAQRAGESIDPTPRYMEALLWCPAEALEHMHAGVLHARADSLAPQCNFR